MLRRLYAWVMRLSASRHAGLALAAIAFAESSFFPIPPDVLLAPMVLARPERAWRFAAICAAGSVIGGLAGYAIGYSLAPVGHWLLAMTGHPGGEATLRAALRPLGRRRDPVAGPAADPLQAADHHLGPGAFRALAVRPASIVVRSMRFFGVAAIVKRFGPAMLPVIQRRLALITLAVVVVIIGVVIVVRYLHL